MIRNFGISRSTGRMIMTRVSLEPPWACGSMDWKIPGFRRVFIELSQQCKIFDQKKWFFGDNSKNIRRNLEIFQSIEPQAQGGSRDTLIMMQLLLVLEIAKLCNRSHHVDYIGLGSRRPLVADPVSRALSIRLALVKPHTPWFGRPAF